MGPQRYQSCIEACDTCADACDYCSSACLLVSPRKLRRPDGKR